MRILLPAFVAFVLAGCGASQPTVPDFEGRWTKFDDTSGAFVEFTSGQITLGDKSDARTGSFTFELADDQEPLYRVVATLASGERTFELYFERDTILLTGLSDQLDGLYEINFLTDPIQPR